MKKWIVILSVWALFSVVFIFAAVFHNEQANGPSPKQTVYVPDAKTAVKIAEAVWLPIYGDVIYKEKPFVATLKGDVWTVRGTLPKGMYGGVAEIDISEKDGRILRETHYK